MLRHHFNSLFWHVPLTQCGKKNHLKSYLLPSKKQKVLPEWHVTESPASHLLPKLTSTNKQVTVTSFMQFHISLSQPVNQIKSCTCWLMMYKLKQIPSAYLNSTCWQECPSSRVTFKQGITTTFTMESNLQDDINPPPEQKCLFPIHGTNNYHRSCTIQLFPKHHHGNVLELRTKSPWRCKAENLHSWLDLICAKDTKLAQEVKIGDLPDNLIADCWGCST